jgi:hypothetical protein
MIDISVRYMDMKRSHSDKDPLSNDVSALQKLPLWLLKKKLPFVIYTKLKYDKYSNKNHNSRCQWETDPHSLSGNSAIRAWVQGNFSSAVMDMGKI